MGVVINLELPSIYELFINIECIEQGNIPGEAG